MKDYQVMPPLTDEEYAELKADIAERGVMVPIELDQDGNVLDGHHRLKICEELGITTYPTVVRVFDTEEARLTHARKLNLARRHLTQEQVDRLTKDEIKADPSRPDSMIANEIGVSDKTVTRARQELESVSEIPKLDTRIGKDGKVYPAHRHRKSVSVFNPSTRDADALRDPDIQRRLAENDGMNVAGAIREQRRDQLVEHLESVETREAKAIQGVYDVIVIDPPWDMARIETDARPHAVKMDYPTMTTEEIKQLKIPAADDCHVYLWTTQKYLPQAFGIFEAWGVKYVCCFVWHKDNGYKPFQLPKYNGEFVLYGHIGSPQIVDESGYYAVFNAPIRGHSIKPDEFYDMIRHVTAGRRLDMFSRRPIDGFDSWGKEANE